MAKLQNYKGSVTLISGIKQANGQDFPLAEANAIQIDENGKRLDEALNELSPMFCRWKSAAQFKIRLLPERRRSNACFDKNNTETTMPMEWCRNNRGKSMSRSHTYSGMIMFGYICYP